MKMLALSTLLIPFCLFSTASAEEAASPLDDFRLKWELEMLGRGIELLFMELAECVLWSEENRHFTESEAEALERAERIRAEVEALPDHAWAGVYARRGESFLTEGPLEWALALAPKGGFVWGQPDLLKGTEDAVRNSGVANWSGGAVRLRGEILDDFDRETGLGEKMIPVRWGERRYLIAEERMVDFCNAVNSGEELDKNRIHVDSFFVRLKDMRKEASGVPDVGEPYRSMILGKELAGEVLDITRRKPRSDDEPGITVTLNVGSRDGVFRGMKLYFREPLLYRASVRVETVSAGQCSATVVNELDERIASRLGEIRPQKGWRLSSRYCEEKDGEWGETPTNVEKHAWRIRAEVARHKDHPWAGTYIQTALLGGVTQAITVAPSNGFCYVDAIGEAFSENVHGPLKWDGTAILLPRSVCSERELWPKMRFVRWGERRYLIAERNLLRFCNEVNSHGEENSDGRWRVYSDFVHSDDTRKEAHGIPTLPPPYRSWILKKALRATILNVKKVPDPSESGSGPAKIVATLNVGRKDGVFPGMRLFFHEPEIIEASAVVESLEDATCEVAVESRRYEWQEEELLKVAPQQGWVLSSRRFREDESTDVEEPASAKPRTEADGS